MHGCMWVLHTADDDARCVLDVLARPPCTTAADVSAISASLTPPICAFATTCSCDRSRMSVACCVQFEMMQKSRDNPLAPEAQNRDECPELCKMPAWSMHTWTVYALCSTKAYKVIAVQEGWQTATDDDACPAI
jgi:hypothetical protein